MITHAFTIHRRQDLILPLLLIITSHVAMAPLLFGASSVMTSILTLGLGLLPLWVFCFPHADLEGEWLWSALVSHDEQIPASQRILEMIDELDYTASFVRKSGLVALEKNLPMLNYSQPYLRTCLQYVLDAKSDSELQTLCQRQDTAYTQAEETVLNALWHRVETLLPISTFINTFMVILALKQVLSPEIAGLSLLMSVGTWASVYFVFNPFLRQLETRHQQNQSLRRMIQQGVQGVWHQLHPQALRRDLEAYLPPSDWTENGSESPLFSHH